MKLIMKYVWEMGMNDQYTQIATDSIMWSLHLV